MLILNMLCLCNSLGAHLRQINLESTEERSENKKVDQGIFFINFKFQSLRNYHIHDKLFEKFIVCTVLDSYFV